MYFKLHQQQSETRPFFFSIFSDDNTIELVSQSYSNREDCLDGVIQAIADLRDPNGEFDDFWIQKDGLFFIELNGEEDVAIATSKQSYPDEETVENILQMLLQEATQGEFEGIYSDSDSLSVVSTASVVPRSYDLDLSSSSSIVVFSNVLPEEIQFQFYLVEKEDLYYFLFNHKSGEEEQNFLFSPGFSSESKRNRHIGLVIKNAANLYRYTEHQGEEGYYFTLHSRNNMELARSADFSSASEMKLLINAFILEANWWADNLEKYYQKKPRPFYALDRYDLNRVSSSKFSGFEKYEAERDGKQQYFFLLNGIGGATLLYSEAYHTERGRDNGIRSVIRNAGIEDRYQLREENGQYYFVLLAGNRQEIGRSGYFNSRDEVAQSVNWMQTNATSWANEYNVNLDQGGITSNRERIRLLIDDGKKEETVITPPIVTAKEAPERDRRSWLWPLIAGILAVLLLATLFRGCFSDSTGPDKDSPVVEPTIVRDTIVEKCVYEDYYGRDSLKVYLKGEEPDLNGQIETELEWNKNTLNAVIFNFWIGSAEGQILHFLNNPSATGSKTFVLERIIFPHNSPKLNKAGYPQTYNLGNILRNYPGIRFQFHGYIASDENDQYKGTYSKSTSSLSMLRARCLYRKLLAVGIPKSSMSFVGHGKENQITSGNEEADLVYNRRVEITVTKT